MEELRNGRRRRVPARSLLGAAAFSASLTPACAFLTHQHHQCQGPTRPSPSTESSEKTWSVTRGGSDLRRSRCIPAHTEEVDWRLEPLKLPPLVRSLPKRGSSGEPESGVGGDAADVLGLTKSKPGGYQVQMYRSIMECERNALVYLPTGLGKTLVASLVLRRLLELNPGRQAFFLVETTALAEQQVRALLVSYLGRIADPSDKLAAVHISVPASCLFLALNETCQWVEMGDVAVLLHAHHARPSATPVNLNLAPCAIFPNLWT